MVGEVSGGIKHRKNSSLSARAEHHKRDGKEGLWSVQRGRGSSGGLSCEGTCRRGGVCTASWWMHGISTGGHELGAEVNGDGGGERQQFRGRRWPEAGKGWDVFKKENLYTPRLLVEKVQAVTHFQVWRPGSLSFLLKSCDGTSDERGKIQGGWIAGFLKNWSIVDLQHCVICRCTAKWYTHTHIHSFFSNSFPLEFEDIECSSLCYTVSPCLFNTEWCVSVNPITPNLSFSSPVLFGNHSLFSMYVSSFSFVHKCICAVFQIPHVGDIILFIFLWLT